MDFVAGAVFGDVGLSLFVAGATVPGILIDSRRQTVVFFPNTSPRWAGKVSEAAGAR